MPTYSLGSHGVEFPPAIERTLFVFAGIALYNAVELIITIVLFFRRKKGLYFWSLLISSVSILPWTLGFLFKFFNVIPQHLNYLSITIIVIGWHGMVTGQSVVLYSRLHLVSTSRKLLRLVLGLIIANWFISNVPTTVFAYLANSKHAAMTAGIYGVWERLQLTLYFVLEVFISGVYMVQISRILKPDVFDFIRRESVKPPSDTKSILSGVIPKRFRKGRGRRIMKHLLYVNVVIIILDISLLTIEYLGYYEVQVLWKSAVYSIKLKMEFRILNQLTDMASEKLRESQQYFSNTTDSARSAPADSRAMSHPLAEKEFGPSSPSAPGSPLSPRRSAAFPVQRKQCLFQEADGTAAQGRTWSTRRLSYPAPLDEDLFGTRAGEEGEAGVPGEPRPRPTWLRRSFTTPELMLTAEGRGKRGTSNGQLDIEEEMDPSEGVGDLEAQLGPKEFSFEEMLSQGPER